MVENVVDQQPEQRDAPQGKESRKKEAFALSVATSPDGRLLACGGSSGAVVLFDIQSGKCLGSLEGHYKPVRSLTFTPGGLPQLPPACRRRDGAALERQYCGSWAGMSVKLGPATSYASSHGRPFMSQHACRARTGAHVPGNAAQRAAAAWCPIDWLAVPAAARTARK